MISGLVGLPGHGKTLEAVRQAGREHKRGDCHVYANIPLNLERFTLVTPVTLADVRVGACACNCKRVFVLLDEVHLWLPSRRSLQLPTTWLALFSQTRKAGWNLWWTAQNEMRVDVILRDITTFVYSCNGWAWPIEFYVYERWEMRWFRNPRRRLGKSIRRRSRSASALYNTGGSVVGADHTRDRNDPYAVGAGAALVDQTSAAPVAASEWSW